EYPALRDYSVYRFSEKQDLCAESMKNDANITSLMRVVNSFESPMRERIARAYNRLLSHLPVTSAKLSMIYLSEWKGDLAGREISPTIANQMYFSLMDETLGDELGGEIDLLHDHPSAVYEKLAPLLEKGDSSAFDNITTIEEIENMDKIFNLSFIKAMRILHRHYGPEMGKWRWDGVGRPSYMIPFVRPSRFSINADSYYDDSVHYSAEISYSEKGNFMKPVTVSNLSLLRWGDVFWGANFPLSLSAGSEYYGNAPVNRRMIPFSGAPSVHTITLLPSVPK
ncbi:MAG TPA: penicillin acylase family protein, partial [Spirochaetota bacterium]